MTACSALAFQTVTSLYEAVVPPSEKCINYVKSVEISRSEEKALPPEPEVVVNGIVEAETHLTLLDEPEESLADQVNERAPDLSQATLQAKREKEVPVEVELVDLTTSVNESLQFPEIEEILDSGKTSEIGEVRSELTILPSAITITKNILVLFTSKAKYLIPSNTIDHYRCYRYIPDDELS